MVGTALCSAVGCIVCGLMANVPFGLAPGTGLTVYLTYGLVLNNVMTLQQGMTTCLLSGIALAVCSLIRVSKLVINATPDPIKNATVVGMGLLIALIGMKSINLVVANELTLVGLGDLSDYNIWLAVAGLILTGTLLYHEITGAILIGIVLLTLIVWIINKSGPHAIIEMPHLELSLTDLISFKDLDSSQISAVVAFLFVAIFDIAGVMFGMSKEANLLKEDGSTDGDIWVFLAASIGTIVGAMTGSSPIIVQVETIAGIKEGGRTGLTAVTIGCLFASSVFLAPIFSAVPPTATAPILMLVGAMMMAGVERIDWSSFSHAIPAFLTIAMMPFSFSITNGIIFGIVTSFYFYMVDTVVRPFTTKFRRGSRGQTGRGEYQTINSTRRDEIVPSSPFMTNEPPVRSSSFYGRRGSDSTSASINNSNTGGNGNNVTFSSGENKQKRRDNSENVKSNYGSI